jgi:alpha-glucosidase
LVEFTAADAGSLVWEQAPPGVLHFRRPGGWHCVTNFSGEPVPLPAGELLLASAPIAGSQLPPAATVWLRT